MEEFESCVLPLPPSFPLSPLEAPTHSSWGKALGQGSGVTTSGHQAYPLLDKFTLESWLEFRVTCEPLYPFLEPCCIL